MFDTCILMTMVCVKIARDCGQTKITFIALLLNIILCYIFFRRDHIREEQSLRICQGHPNIVKLQEVFQDAVSALCKVLQSRISYFIIFEKLCPCTKGLL